MKSFFALLAWLCVLGLNQSALASDDIGASVPYTRYEAEMGAVVGTPSLVGPNRNVGDLGGEASGRVAVKLATKGDGIEWVAKSDANSIVVRNCIPDSDDGAGLNATLSLYVNDVKKDSLYLTSKYAWLYGPEADPKNLPALGSPRHIYDESHAFLPFTIKKGDRIKLQKDAGDTAPYYGIDFVELERVAPPLPCPSNLLNIADENIIPGNFSDRIGPLIQKFENPAGYRGKQGIYIPSGRYPMSEQAVIGRGIVPGFQIRGAGMWHTQIYNDSDAEAGWGIFGFNLNAQTVTFSDFALFGGGRTQNGAGKPFFNSYGDGTTIRRIWIEHMTCGLWVGGAQGVTNHLTIDSCRLRNLGADGINLCNGTKNSTIVNTTVRSSGDDGIAIWSAPEMDGAVNGTDYIGCANNVIKNCTVELPWRASAFAIYGGKDNAIVRCIARDTLTYAGVNISSTFKPRPFEGTTRVEDVLLERCGGAFWSKQQFGALWLMADDSPLSGIVVRNVSIVDATYAGLLLQSETYNKPAHPLSADFENVTVNNSGTYGLEVRSATGRVNFVNTHLSTALTESLWKGDTKAGITPLQINVDKRSSGFEK